MNKVINVDVRLAKQLVEFLLDNERRLGAYQKRNPDADWVEEKISEVRELTEALEKALD